MVVARLALHDVWKSCCAQHALNIFWLYSKETATVAALWSARPGFQRLGEYFGRIRCSGMGKRKLNIFDVFAVVLSHVLCA